MQKIVLIILTLSTLVCGSQSFAATTAPATPAATPSAATTTATAATPQQNRMKSCAAQYHQKNIAKSQYHAFMSNCLKNPSTAKAAATAPATAKPAVAK